MGFDWLRGYAVERAIHGPEAPCNDIARWDCSALMMAFAPGRADLSARRAVTLAELTEALGAARTSTGLTLIEAVVPRMDVPPPLSQIAREAGRVNARPASQAEPPSLP